MAWCALSIELDEPAAEFRQGDAIAGEVCVRVRQAGHCNGLALVCVWFTRGEGPPEERRVRRQRLYAGAWPTGEYRYRFSLSAPRGPLSYDGEAVAVAWRLEACAELAWSRDVSASVEFRLGARRGADIDDPYEFGPGPFVPPVVTREGPSWVARAFGLMAFAQLAYLAPTPVLVVSPLLAAGLLYGRWRRSRLWVSELRVAPQTTCPGQTIEVTLALDIPGGSRIDAFMVELKAVAQWHGGREISERELHAQVSQLGPANRIVREGERVCESTTFSLPSDAPYTFSGFHNAICWRIIAYATIFGRVAWINECVLVVRPGRPSGGVYRRPAE